MLKRGVGRERRSVRFRTKSLKDLFVGLPPINSLLTMINDPLRMYLPVHTRKTLGGAANGSGHHGCLGVEVGFGGWRRFNLD